MTNKDLKKYIKDIKDFPKKGIIFKDITPLLNNGAAFKYAVDQIIEYAKKRQTTVIVAPEARGFIFGAAAAFGTKIRFVPIRKPNKLPDKKISVKYELEYGIDWLEIHKNALTKNDKVLIVDDLLATGGTIKAQIELIRQLQADIVGAIFVIDLTFLHDENVFEDIEYKSLIKY